MLRFPKTHNQSTYRNKLPSLFIRKIASHINNIINIGFVVPMVQLRSTIKSIFKTVDGLSEEMVYAPEEVIGKYFDLLVVDEAHRLYRRKHLPGQHLYKIFDKINRNLKPLIGLTEILYSLLLQASTNLRDLI